MQDVDGLLEPLHPLSITSKFLELLCSLFKYGDNCFCRVATTELDALGRPARDFSCPSITLAFPSTQRASVQHCIQVAPHATFPSANTTHPHLITATRPAISLATTRLAAHKTRRLLVINGLAHASINFRRPYGPDIRNPVVHLSETFELQLLRISKDDISSGSRPSVGQRSKNVTST
ncbi:hypothetical protein BJV78DRAFT_739375 [Lactifluus subvellereus]|nr:hypothetical protein BJV78DRAFT_739375 [Lactifluus subvellereus]